MKKILFLFIFILAYTQFLVSSEDVYINIDNLINDKNLSELNVLLENNSNLESYKEIENYIISKVKSLVIEGDFDFGKSILKILLANNLNNKELQDIYLSLNEQIEQSKLDDRKAEEEFSKRSQELTIREREKREKNQQEEKQVKTNKVVPSFGLDNFSFSFNLGLLDFMFYQSQYYTDYSGQFKPNFKYGMSFDLGFYCHLPFLDTGLDFYFDSYFAGLNNKSGIEISYKLLSATTTPYIKVPLYLRGGFGQIYYYFDDSTINDLYVQSFITPIIGLRMKNYYFNKYVGIDGTFDFYLISLFTSKMDAAFDSSISLLIKFYTRKKIGLLIKTELIGVFIIGNSKLENNLKLQISFGIGLNEK